MHDEVVNALHINDELPCEYVWAKLSNYWYMRASAGALQTREKSTREKSVGIDYAKY